MNVSHSAKDKLIISICVIVGAVFLFIAWQVYAPNFFGDQALLIYTAQKGLGDEDIAKDLQKMGIIKSSFFFRLYVVGLGNHRKLQAGTYSLSSSMSINTIVKKLVLGDVVKNNAVIIEGWDLKNISKYLESKDYYSAEDFLDATKKDWSMDYAFLKDKPKKLSLEGYIFPDTYQVYQGETLEDFLKNTLSNFDKKLTPALQQEITLQRKSIFEVITMASIIEKEVKSLDDKKMVSGILWKRLKNNMGLNVDSTINYITGNSDPSVAIKDTKIDSPYNTYKYRGLPLGPIANPGMDSILASIYPENSLYWYYLSADRTGTTIFSKTLEEHNIAVAKYLK